MCPEALFCMLAGLIAGIVYAKKAAYRFQSLHIMFTISILVNSACVKPADGYFRQEKQIP